MVWGPYAAHDLSVDNLFNVFLIFLYLVPSSVPSSPPPFLISFFLQLLHIHKSSLDTLFLSPALKLFLQHPLSHILISLLSSRPNHLYIDSDVISKLFYLSCHSNLLSFF